MPKNIGAWECQPLWSFCYIIDFSSHDIPKTKGESGRYGYPLKAPKADL